MGAGQSINLSENDDFCRLPEITKEVKGLSSNSSSPSDTWIITTNDNVYYDNQRIEKIFMKYFINPEYLKDTLKFQPNPQQEKTLVFNAGLLYELYIYKDVIRPLIDYNVCDNFIKFLGTGINCPYESLYESLKSLNFQDKEYNIQRNVVYMSNLKRNRPAITNIKEKFIPAPNVFNVNAKNMKYMFIMNEAIKPTTVTLEEYLLSKSVQIDVCVLFQIVYTCYAMYTTGMAHNDLHAGNCYIEVLDPPQILTYVYGEDKKRCSMLCGYKIKVYDFDRSYYINFGDNIINNKAFCDEFGMCNEVVQFKDLWKTLSVIYQNNKLFPLDLFATGNKVQLLQEYLSDEKSGYYMYKGRHLTRQEIEQFNSYEQILDNLTIYLSNQNMLSQQEGRINECRPSLFTNNVLDKDKFKKTPEEMTNIRLRFQEVYKDLENKCKQEIANCEQKYNQLYIQYQQLLTQKQNTTFVLEPGMDTSL